MGIGGAGEFVFAMLHLWSSVSATCRTAGEGASLETDLLAIHRMGAKFFTQLAYCTAKNPLSFLRHGSSPIFTSLAVFDMFAPRQARIAVCQQLRRCTQPANFYTAK